jgi:4-hydroxybenzoyl-CoA reductase subunit beta
MSLPRFEYLTPATLSKALSLAGEDTVFVAGGTDMFVRMKDRICTPKRVIGLENIAKLRGIKALPKGGLRIGAFTTLTDLAEAVSAMSGWEFLREVVELTSSPLLRNTGTIGGNLCQESRCTYYNQPPIFRKRWPRCFKLGGDVCHVVKGGESCYAVNSGDLAGPLMALDAVVTIAGSRGSREVAMEKFFTGSGLKPTVVEKGEILTEIKIPKLPQYGGFSYQKLRLRDTIDFPLLGISLFIEFDAPEEGSKCKNARFVLSAVGPSPLRVRDGKALLNGRAVTDEVVEEAGLLLQKMAKPVANTASSPRYRREMIPVLTRRAFQHALEQTARRQ